MVLMKCIVCQRAFKNPSPQREGDLPEDRLQIVAPFAVSGADVFGPYPVRHGGRGTTKRWVLLVTCMVTRAIALFPLKDMTSATVINALVRLNSQFPSVKKLYSDNGSNFRSADRELKEVTDKWNKNDLDRQLGDIGITWVFGPANCGSYGGVWERMVGLVKKHFKATIKDHVLDLDVFETFLAGVTSVVNKRPILEASSDVDDFLVLSPSHFLYPYILTDSSNSILPPSTDGGDALRKSWHATQQLLDEFWEIFKKDYITSLAKKTKWRNTTESPSVGDIVLITDPNEKRDNWKTGRIVQILSADPDHARRFLVKDAKGRTFDRHVTGLVTLELEGSISNRSNSPR